jgi:serine-type D-Ala-D-Ala carboxypeptidase/endopeptidase
VISYGRFGQGDARPLDGNALFELGSVTKVYTSLLLAAMVRHGEAALDEPVQELLPVGVRVPTRKGRSITLHDLATHSSGLPPMAENFVVSDPENPYRSYSVDDLYRFCRHMSCSIKSARSLGIPTLTPGYSGTLCRVAPRWTTSR